MKRGHMSGPYQLKVKGLHQALNRDRRTVPTERSAVRFVGHATSTFTIAALTVLLHFVGVGADVDSPNTGMADPTALVNAFDRARGREPGNVLVLSLSNLRGLSTESVNAGGRVTIDLAAGTVTSTVTLLPSDRTFDLWLVDNRPGAGHTTLADPFDAMVRVGTYAVASGVQTLGKTLGAAAFVRFFPDRAFVVPSGQSPVSSFLLTGQSTLFDRLRHRQVRFVDEADETIGFDPLSAGRTASFAKLVADGRRLFLTEPFSGNGRTCGTCHVERNNFTIDPDFIATLPPDDPLFVAENDSALAALEHPDLMRRFGLILVNADGFEPFRGFVLRAAQNIQALGNSTTAPDPFVDPDFSTHGLNPDPPERLGWGNDGPPLRDFALVAIAQHATRTLARIPGSDFRVATDEELDALAAYQLSLGRQEDFDLAALELTSAFAARGKTLYLDTGDIFETGHKNCNACHFNGGGTTGLTFNSEVPGFPRLDGSPHGFNAGAATSVNDTPLALQLGLPRDGGFGTIQTAFGSFGNTEDLPPPFGRLEIEEFNVPPVVESADTGPFFHNHSARDLESAVAFYGTAAFQGSIFGRFGVPVTISADPADEEVQAISAFLRVLNALENIRSSIDVAERARRLKSGPAMRELAGLSLAEAIDATQVLSQGSLARRIEPGLRSARARLLAASLTLEAARHLPTRRALDKLLDVSARTLRDARSALANPATLPVSFRN